MRALTPSAKAASVSATSPSRCSATFRAAPGQPIVRAIASSGRKSAPRTSATRPAPHRPPPVERDAARRPPELAGEKAIARRRRAAALDVPEHADPRLELRQTPHLLREPEDAARLAALRDDDDAAALAPLPALAYLA